MKAPSIDQHLVSAERRLVEMLSLRPRELQPQFAQARGLWKDSPVSITSRVYEGDAVSYMRVALVSGVALSVGGLLVQGRPNRALPMLGADLVCLGAGRDAAVTVDLSPVGDEARREADCRDISRALPVVSDFPPGGERPAWMAKWCSGNPLHTRVPPERLEAALDVFDKYVNAWIGMSGASVPEAQRADNVREQQRAYLDARRDDADTRKLLSTMFGCAWSEDYLREVMFPVTTVGL